MAEQKQKNRPTFKPGTVKRLLKYIVSEHKTQFVIVLIAIIISSVSVVFSSVMIQQLIDTVIEPGIINGMSTVYGDLIVLIIIMASVYLLNVIAGFIYTRIMAVVTQKTLYNFRIDLFNRMQSLPIGYYDTHQHGDIMSTYTNDTDAIRQLIGQVLPQILQSIITTIAIFVMMIGYSIWLLIVVIICLFLMMQISKKLAMGSTKYMMKRQRSIAKEEGFIEEFINGQKVVKVFNYEDESKKQFDEINQELFEDSEKAFSYSNIMMPVMNNLSYLMYVIIAFIGGIFIIQNVPNISILGYSTVTTGMLIAFLTFVRNLGQTIGRIGSQVGMISMALAGASRIFELMDESPEQDEGYVTLVNFVRNSNGDIIETNERNNQWAWKHLHQSTGQLEYIELKGDIVLENVDFSYVPGKEVLHDISLYAHAGQKIALVGHTGAGKTTITNLINRFYDIPDGKIRYDGINIRKIKKADLRRSLGIVLQDINLFTGTVLENIRYGRLEATDAECIEAAKKANAHDFITRLPEGYGTILTANGGNLSQGQRQLISIARAEVADTPVMILDEATSSIDTRTEALVQAGMDQLMEGRTVFVIAHRLSTIRNSDAIMVMDQGKIIERGNHDSLLKLKGVYQNLYTGLFELE